jgi:hypothetical protein
VRYSRPHLALVYAQGAPLPQDAGAGFASGGASPVARGKESLLDSQPLAVSDTAPEGLLVEEEHRHEGHRSQTTAGHHRSVQGFDADMTGVTYSEAASPASASPRSGVKQLPPFA